MDATRLRWLFCLAPLLLLTGCISFEEGSLADMAFKELGDSKLSDLLWASFGWTALGGVVGGLVGLALFFVLKKVGAYRWEWRFAWIAHVLAALCLVAGFSGAGALIGLGEGFVRGSRVVLDESQLGTKVFPHLGDAAADASYVLAELGGRIEKDPQAELSLPDLTGFRSGSTELDVTRLVAVAKLLPKDGVENVSQRLQDDLVQKYPSLKGGNTEKLVGKAVRLTFGSLAQDQAAQGMKSLSKAVPGLDKTVEALIAGLPTAAAAGDPNTISRKDLSHYYVRQGIVPTLMLPITSTVRSYQLGAAVGALLALLLPLGTIRLLEWIRAKGAGPEAPPTPPVPGAPEGPAPPAAGA